MNKERFACVGYPVPRVDAFDSLLANVRRKTSPSTLFQLLLLWEYQVVTMDRKSFGRIGIEGLHSLRLSIATVTVSLKKGIKRIAAAEDREGFLGSFWGANKNGVGS